MKLSFFPAAILLLLCALGCRSQEVQECPIDAQQSNGSRICVRLKFTDGRIDFDKDRSRISLSETFLQRLKIPETQAEEILFADLRRLFDSLQKPYRLALTDDERKLDDKYQFNDKTEKVRSSSGEWLEFREIFNEWAAAGNRSGSGFDEIFESATATDPAGGIIFPLTVADRTTASIIYEDGGYDPAEGVITFAIADPINNWSDPAQAEILLPDVTDTKKRESRIERIREKLESLSGKPRCRDCIENRLSAFYRSFGLTPSISFDNRHTSPLRITIIESPRIDGVSWKTLQKNDENIDKILYSLLTDKAFRQFLKRKPEIADLQSFNYQQHLGQIGPYLNVMRLQIQQLLVNQMGYTVSIAPAEGVSKYNLVIQKTSDLEEETAPAQGESHTRTPKSAPATATEEGVVTAHEQERETETEFVPKVESPENDRNKKAEDKKRYIGGGFEYRPGQGFRFFGLGQISRFPFLPGAINTFSAKLGAQNGDEVIGSLNYFADYLFFNKLHRRISLQLTIASDLEADRNLSGAELDERRKSGLIRFEFEPFRDKSGSLLRFFAEAKRSTVSFQSGTQPLTKQNLTTLDIGALYFYETIEVERPLRIRFEPKFRAGLGAASGEPRFAKLLVAGNAHKALPRRFEADVSGRFEIAGSQTPLYELPSFGDAQVVRGFRRDEALGRKLWSLQNELWIPLPIGNEESGGFKAMLRENVKLAPFLDAGGLYDAVTGTAGNRFGAGVGLRFIYNPIVFKFDYAYGFQSTRRRGKFYFSVTSNLPF